MEKKRTQELNVFKIMNLLLFIQKIFNGRTTHVRTKHFKRFMNIKLHLACNVDFY